jgi:glyoxylase-like metal-dependent hydrolase (beta-lactamase superfamily II)
MITVALLALALQTPPAPAAAPRPRPARPPTPPPAQLVARALDLVGGAATVRDVPGATLESYIVNFGIGQEETPAGTARASVNLSRTVVDLRGTRRLQTLEIRGPGGMVNRQRRVTAGGISMVENTQGAQQADPPATVANVERGIRMSPDRLLLAASDSGAALTALPAKTLRGVQYHGARFINGADTVNLYFDRASGGLTFIEQVTDDPILGDRTTTTSFSRWQDAGGGLRLPRQIDVEVNGRLQSQSIITAATVGAAPDSLFAIPDSIAARAQRAPATPTPPVVTVNMVELAPGVWRAEGGTHFSLVVEQPDQLVVVEAPQTTARMRAVLDTLRARFPSKPVGIVVNTHHHWDHAGGLRAVMAAGLPVATHRGNVEFVRGIGSAKKTVAPDALSRPMRAGLTVRAVDDSLTIGSGDSRVILFRLPTTHVEGMLAAYVPAARLLFQSDVLSPAATLPQLGAAEVAALARVRGIAVERVVGGHGGIASWPDVERAAGN